MGLDPVSWAVIGSMAVATAGSAYSMMQANKQPRSPKAPSERDAIKNKKMQKGTQTTYSKPEESMLGESGSVAKGKTAILGQSLQRKEKK